MIETPVTIDILKLQHQLHHLVWVVKDIVTDQTYVVNETFLSIQQFFFCLYLTETLCP